MESDDRTPIEFPHEVLYTHQGDLYALHLTHLEITWSRVKRGESIRKFFSRLIEREPEKLDVHLPLHRIVGVIRMKSPNKEGFRLVTLSELTKERTRNEEIFTFHRIFEKDQESAEIAEEVDEFVRRIESHVHVSRWWNQSTAGSHETTASDPSGSPRSPHGRKVLFVVNPVGGRGDALRLWRHCRRLLSLAKLPFDEIVTESSGHGAAIASSLDVRVYQALVCVSGDGLLHEIINGIMKRSDNADVLEGITLGIVPAGSGNGLAASLGTFDVNASVYAVLHGHTKPADLLGVRFTANGQLHTRFAFLSVTWAMLSVIDLDSEAYRFLGPLRFDMKGVVETIAADTYRGTLTYLPASDLVESTAQKRLPAINGQVQWSALEADRSFWQMMDEELHVFLASNAPFIQLAPGPHANTAHLSDGAVDLVLLPKSDRLDLAKAMLMFDDGRFHTAPGVVSLKAKAFRLEVNPTWPHQAPISVDGERVDTQLIETEVFESPLNFFAEPK